MEVRPARLEDCAALADGMSEVVSEGRWLATVPGTSVEDLEQRFRASVEWDESLLFALFDGERPVGALGMRPTGADGVLSLGMWILPAWRGRGGGRMLIDAAIAARPTAIHKIELEVFPDNDAAISLYRSAGFEEEGLRRDHYRREDGSLRSALIMARLFRG